MTAVSQPITNAGSFGEARARIARALAKEGLGYEDICVRMSKQAPWRWEWQPIVKVIVLRKL